MTTSKTPLKDLGMALVKLNNYYSRYVNPLVSFGVRRNELGFVLIKETDDWCERPKEETVQFGTDIELIMEEIDNILEDAYNIEDSDCI